MSDKPASPFAQALATLTKDFPSTFQLEVEEHVFLDLKSQQAAHELSAAMERMKVSAVRMGYTVKTTFNAAKLRWVYDFKLRPGFKKPAAEPKHLA